MARWEKFLVLGTMLLAGLSGPAGADTVKRVSVGRGGVQADRNSFRPAISAAGRYIAFVSVARHLVRNDRNRLADIFLRDRQAGTTERVSIGPGGGEANGASFSVDLSNDARFVAFHSGASNLVAGVSHGSGNVFVRDRETGRNELISVDLDGRAAGASISLDMSGDGRRVAFTSMSSNVVEGDTDEQWDVFVRDRVAGTTVRVSTGQDGHETPLPIEHMALADGGRFVAFHSHDNTLVPGDADANAPGDWDIFVRDLNFGNLIRASVGHNGRESNGDSLNPSLSADGRLVAFHSDAGHLVERDNNGVDDIFVYDTTTGLTRKISGGPGVVEADGSSIFPAILPAAAMSRSNRLLAISCRTTATALSMSSSTTLRPAARGG